ncbi:ABC-type transport auxiliary lipoprotein family protein [Thiolapillus sp.]
MKKLLSRMLPIFAIALLAACAGKPQPPVTEYSLSPRIQPRTSTELRLPVTLKLAPVNASQKYMTTDIVYVDGKYRRNSYAYSRWVDTPVHMLQLVLQDGLERSGLFQAVLPSSSLLRADLRLEATLYEFSQQLKPGQKSEGVVRLGFHLLDVRESRLLASRQFEVRVPAPSLDAQGGVSAINAAVAALLPRLVNWLRGNLATP